MYRAWAATYPQLECESHDSFIFILHDSFCNMQAMQASPNMVETKPKWLAYTRDCQVFSMHSCGTDKRNEQPLDLPMELVPAKPWVRPHSNNASKQDDIFITRGWMKTLAIRSDFDLKFSAFRVLIWGLGFQGFRFRILGFVILESKNLNPKQGFEHVKGYAGFAAGKPRVCSELVSGSFPTVFWGCCCWWVMIMFILLVPFCYAENCDDDNDDYNQLLSLRW